MRGAASWVGVALATALGLSAVPSLASGAEASGGKPPVKSFFRHADLSGASLSPSGRWLAVGNSPDGMRTALVVLDLEGKVAPAVVAGFADADVHRFQWVNDERLVFDTLDLQTGVDDQSFRGGLFAVGRDGKDFRRLVNSPRRFVGGPRPAGPEPLTANHRWLVTPRTGGDDVIVGEYQWDNVGEPTRVHPVRLNTLTGRSTALDIAPPTRISRWLFDPRGEPRVAIRWVDGVQEVFWRGPGETTWRTIAKGPALEMRFDPVAVDGAGQLFVAVGNPPDRAVLRRFDFATGAPEASPLVSAMGFDFDGSVVSDHARTRALGFRVHTDAESTVWSDPDLRAVQQAADARFPGRVNRLSCGNCVEGGPVLVHSYSDQDPGSYWIHRRPGGTWESVGRARKDIDSRAMAPMDFHRVQSRDGSELPLWITALPKGQQGPRAAVVLMRSSFWGGRRYWGWAPDAQFLASRGYVVIQPEPRGVDGYGQAHFQRGWKQSGSGIEDDIADAVAWAAKQGLVDERRVCIAGDAFGGQAALLSLARHPDLYRCGVAWSAVTDVPLLFTNHWQSNLSQQAKRWTLPRVFGDPASDTALLRTASPTERTSETKAPVLLAYGRQDRHVPIEHGTRMRDALRAAGRPPEWIVYDDEAHGWLKVENRVDFWTRVESFLDRHLASKETKP